MVTRRVKKTPEEPPTEPDDEIVTVQGLLGTLDKAIEAMELAQPSKQQRFVDAFTVIYLATVAAGKYPHVVTIEHRLRDYIKTARRAATAAFEAFKKEDA